VLPFTNISGDPEQEYFVDGMTDDLITDLSKISGLFVIARNSVFTYKDKPVKIKQVSRELGVRYVLEGSVRKVGHKVRINAQLIDAATDNHLWADRYDDDLNDVFALQDRITRKIVSALSIKLTANEQEQVSRKHTDNLEAYDFFLRGKQLYYSLNIDVIDEAKAMFSKAIELDPQFALAYAFHARTNWHKSSAEPESRGESLTEASEYVKKALILDGTLPEAHIVMSLLQHNDGLHDEAVASAAKAVALDYNNAESYVYQSRALTFAGKHEEAFDSINIAFRLDPNPPALYYLNIARIQFNRRQYIEALHNLKKAPDSFSVTMELKVPVFAYAGLLEEARNELKNILKIFPNYSLLFIRNTIGYKLMEDVEHHVEGFRMAGLQHLPSIEWNSDAVFTRENPPAFSLKYPAELITTQLEGNEIFRVTGSRGLPVLAISISKITGEVKESFRGFPEGLKRALQEEGTNVKIIYNRSMPPDAYGEIHPAQECEIDWKYGGSTTLKTYAIAIVKDNYRIQLVWTDLPEAVEQDIAKIKAIFKAIDLEP
jgi:TolB-like protein